MQKEGVDKFLITGSAGQLGYELQRLWGGEEGHAMPRAREALDIANWDQISEWLPQIAPDVIINCAAYNNSVEAETNGRHPCWQTNVQGVEHLCRICVAHDIPLFHISASYVFGQDLRRAQCAQKAVGATNGPNPEKFAYRESDVPGPVNYFGTTKLAAEQVILRYAMEHPRFRWWIIRPGVIYEQPWRHQKNFPFQLARALLSPGSQEVPVLSDVMASFSYAPHLASALRWMVENRDAISNDSGVLVEPGIYHISNHGFATWHELALRIGRKFGASQRIKGVDHVRYAQRLNMQPQLFPTFTGLSTEKYDQTQGPLMPTWEAALDEWLAAAKGYFRRNGVTKLDTD